MTGCHHHATTNCVERVGNHRCTLPQQVSSKRVLERFILPDTYGSTKPSNKEGCNEVTLQRANEEGVSNTIVSSEAVEEVNKLHRVRDAKIHTKILDRRIHPERWE